MNIAAKLREIRNDKDKLPVECFVSRDEVIRLLAIAQAVKNELHAQNGINAAADRMRAATTRKFDELAALEVE